MESQHPSVEYTEINDIEPSKPFDDKQNFVSQMSSLPTSSTLLISTQTDFDETNKFKLLTFNTWGLKYVSKLRKERLVAIANKLASGIKEPNSEDYDLVALQEVWTQEDWDYINNVCAVKYPYRRWFSSGILSGPGLAILSKYPIKRTFLYRFPINGRPSAFFRGDWYVGKSVAITIVSMKSGSTIAVLNSHMHAPYSRTGDAAYEAHRACQAWDIANIINELKAAGHAVVLVGDLNSRPGSLQYRILEQEAGLNDSWEVLNGKTDMEQLKTMDPWDQINKGATTCDSILNTWRADRRQDEACRLDYALIDSKKLSPLIASVEFTEKIPGVGSYSDHFAYSATFKVIDSDGILSEAGEDKTIINEKLDVYRDLKAMILDYMNTTLVWQRKWRLWHFLISIFIFIAILPVITVVSYYAPWSSILFFFFGCIITVTGVVDGMISFLFGRYELRNLREVIFEIDDRLKYFNEYIV